ncbi:MAG: hypothetical protein BJ554DRAFT_4631 [Olpidium bornovanus]|uniref:Na+/H+ antiporter NhaC-like C-terminal domain-containing protein n=1 Tax=Olpidium bornovanus TaxID=278681 RepID=A0A8H7ZMB9_9FUNG|nr:MAG: hypothetical protein BJ554DRAFT_4631 [Olpidium bornovanus]
MSIVFPLAIPMAVGLRPGDHEFLVQTVSSILTGSIFGDQCSPISDTSVLSALSASVSVGAHVWTQLPYAVLVAVVALVFGYLPLGLGIYSAWAGMLVGIAVLTAVVVLIGSNPETFEPSPLYNIFVSVCRLIRKKGKQEARRGDLEETVPADNDKADSKGIPGHDVV